MRTLCSVDAVLHYLRMEHVSDQEVKVIEKKANAIRVSLIESLIEAGSGHTAGPLGMADVFATLFFSVMRYDPKNLLLDTRDRLILSNGHISPVLYATMAHAGYFPAAPNLSLIHI